MISQDQARTTLIIGSCPTPQERHEGRGDSDVGRTGERSCASRQVRRRERPSRVDVDRRLEEAGKVDPGVVWLASGVLQTHARGEPHTHAVKRRQPQPKV